MYRDLAAGMALRCEQSPEVCQQYLSRLPEVAKIHLKNGFLDLPGLGSLEVEGDTINFSISSQFQDYLNGDPEFVLEAIDPIPEGLCDSPELFDAMIKELCSNLVTHGELSLSKFGLFQLKQRRTLKAIGGMLRIPTFVADAELIEGLV